METILAFARGSGIYDFMNSAWGWPTIESLHFIGLSLLLGTVGLFDLRVLGIGRGISMRAVHKLVPLGVAGFSLNVSTGLLFFVSAPDQYAYNPAFQTKMLFILCAGINMFLFYRFAQGSKVSDRGKSLAAIGAAVSLTCWTLVIICGRLITYYRPPYHWCFWC